MSKWVLAILRHFLLQHSIFVFPSFDIRYSSVRYSIFFLSCPFTPSVVYLRHPPILFLHIASTPPSLFLYCSYTKSEDPKSRQCGPKEEAKRSQGGKKAYQKLKHRSRISRIRAIAAILVRLTASLSMLFPPFFDPSSRLLRVLFGKVRLYYEAVPKQTRRRPGETTPFGRLKGPQFDARLH
jgi:hypothetical protein